MNKELGIMNYGLGIKIFLVVFLFIILNSLFIIHVHAATNIIADSPPTFNRWAWNDIIGWIDMYGNGAQNINVKADHLEGYAYNSSVGYIAFDCATTPNGNICAGPAGNWKVANDGNGNLSGWAWNEGVGWISFSYLTGGGSNPYGVTVNTATGEFSGWAWNDVVGWISFNCSNDSTCGTTNFRTKTSVGNSSDKANLTSSVFDIGVDGGTLNAFLWKGSLPNGTVVKFQFASSNSLSGPWNFIGLDGTSATYYQPIGPDIFLEIRGQTNIRYFRYKIFLDSDNWKTYSPQVDNVIINYSP